MAKENAQKTGKKLPSGATVTVTLPLIGMSCASCAATIESEAIKKLMGLAPKTAIIEVDGVEEEVLVSEMQAGDVVRPLQNVPFCPISTSDSDFNPRNTQCIPAVKIFAFLELEQN